MRRQKIFFCILAALLLACSIPSLTVLADDDDFSATLEVSPLVLDSFGGDVTLTFNITNLGDVEITGNDLEVFTTVPFVDAWKNSIMPGETAPSSITVPLASTDLDREIEVVLHIENDEYPDTSDGIQTFTFIVESSDEDPCVGNQNRHRNRNRGRCNSRGRRYCR